MAEDGTFFNRHNVRRSIRPGGPLYLRLLQTALFLGLPSGEHAQHSTPSFDSAFYTREAAEDTAAGENVGAPVTATGGTGALTYTLGGTDASSFAIVAASGQIQTKEGVTYDHEARSSYSVTVTATDTNNATDTATVAITVTDVAEPPLPPPLVDGMSASGSYDSIVVRWLPPDSTGRPPVTGYDVRYRISNRASWEDGPQNVVGTEAVVTGLEFFTPYRVAVRTRNDEGESLWVFAGGEFDAIFTHPLPLLVERAPGLTPDWPKVTFIVRQS